MTRAFFLVVAILALGQNSAWGQANEGAIRQADQNLFINGRVNQPMNFSVTGKLTDHCRVFFPNGTMFQQGTLAQLRNAPFCINSFQNTNGNWTLRFSFIANPVLNGGRVALVRPGFGPIDVDPIRIR